MQFFLCVILVIALAAQLVEAKKMWGSRKKRETADDIVLPSIPKSSLDVMNKRGGAGSTRRHIGSNKGSNRAGIEGMEETLNMYIKMFENLLDSNDFASTVNPESIKAMIEQFPGASNTPEIVALLNSPEFSDPEMLRQTMREGVQMVKSSLGDILAMMSNPEQLKEMMSQFPPEIQPLMEALQSGDMNALKNFVINMPGNFQNNCCSSGFNKFELKTFHLL